MNSCKNMKDTCAIICVRKKDFYSPALLNETYQEHPCHFCKEIVLVGSMTLKQSTNLAKNNMFICGQCYLITNTKGSKAIRPNQEIIESIRKSHPGDTFDEVRIREIMHILKHKQFTIEGGK